MMSMNKKKVNISLKRHNWSSFQIKLTKIWFYGYVRINGRLYSHKNVREYFTNNFFNKQDIQEWHGEFALIIETEGTFLAIVDRKRSVPLFYFKKSKDEWEIADYLFDNVSQYKYNQTAVYEFLLTGYTTNEKTLINNVNQIEAGTYIEITGENMVNVHRYFCFFPLEIENIDLRTAIDEFKSILLNVFESLWTRIKDKKVMIPLSSGYDSRAVALLLKEFSSNDIYSYTYGKENNHEAKISKSISERLGIKWEFYRYTKNDWYQWYNSQDMATYIEYATNYSSIAHIQDWPAVRGITRRHGGEFTFIPGHTGRGGRVPPELALNKQFQATDVINEIFSKHYRLWEINDTQYIYNQTRAEISKSLKEIGFYDQGEASAAYEYWHWKERQSKFIINSLRVYEFFNQNWEIPLWDDYILDFFNKLPIKYRFEKYIYDLTLYEMYPEYFPKPDLTNPVEKLITIKQYDKIYKHLKKLYYKKELISQYFVNPMNWNGISGSFVGYLKSTSFNFEGVKYNNPYNINSFLIKDYIQSNTNKYKEEDSE